MAEPAGRPSLRSRFAAGAKRHAGPTGVPLAVGAYLVHLGQLGRGITIINLALAFLVARLVAGDRVDRLIGRAAAALARWITAALLAMTFVVVLMPSWLLRKAWPRGAGAKGGWHEPPGDAQDPAESFVLEPRPPRSRPVRALSATLTVSGLIVAVLALDITVGTAVGPIRSSHAKVLGPLVRGSRGIRIDSVVPGDPALRSSGWAAENTRELRTLQFEYWPFLAFRTRPHAGATVNTDGWVRRSVDLPAPPAPAPRVDLFGGSMAFGTGERDDHTIASLVAERARAAGLPVTMANNGQPGWTIWQSWLRFEQVSATPAAPDVAVFLNGSEEARAYRPEPTTPSQVGYVALRAGMGGGKPGATSASDFAHAVYEQYENRSLSHQIWTWLTGSDAAGAAIPPRPDLRLPTAPEVADTYRRGRTLATTVAASHRIATVFAWQPTNPTERVARAASSMVGRPTVDLSRLLDTEHDVFLPDGSVNERGARIVADAVWTAIRPELVAWYREHR